MKEEENTHYITDNGAVRRGGWWGKGVAKKVMSGIPCKRTTPVKKGTRPKIQGI